MIDPATGWFEIQQYDDKKSITVAKIIDYRTRIVHTITLANPSHI